MSAVINLRSIRHTMKRFKITYKDGQGSETQSCYMLGTNAEHAEMRFLDSLEEEGGNEGVEIISTCQVSVQDGIIKMA